MSKKLHDANINSVLHIENKIVTCSDDFTIKVSIIFEFKHL